jgi:hypothetical protein
MNLIKLPKAGFLLLLLLLIIGTKKSDVELFEGETLLKDCFVDIPLTYTRANDKLVAIKAKELKDQELVLLNFNNKTKQVSYKRYYLVSDGENGKDIFNYLIAPENYEKYKNGEINAIFLKFRPKYDRFYISKCFDSTMNKHQEILAKWSN